MILFLGGHPAYVGIYSLLMKLGYSVARVFDPNHTYKAVVIGVYDEPTVVFEALKVAYQVRAPILCLSTGDVFSALGPSKQSIPKEPMSERWRPSLGTPEVYTTATTATALAAEADLLHSIADTTIFRLFDVYGEGCDGWISQQLKNAKKNKDILIPDPIKQTRAFLYVEDLEPLLKAWIENPIAGVFHIGSPFEADLLVVAELLKEYTGATSALRHIRSPQYTWWRLPDTKRVAGIYKWKATTSVRLGLKKMV